MVEVAEGKISHRGITNADVMRSDLTEETPDITADISIVSLVLLHIPDTKQILQALYHVLNEGGKLLIIDFDQNDRVNHPKIHSGFSHEALKDLLTEIGFTSTTMETFHHGQRI